MNHFEAFLSDNLGISYISLSIPRTFDQSFMFNFI